MSYLFQNDKHIFFKVSLGYVKRFFVKSLHSLPIYQRCFANSNVADNDYFRDSESQILAFASSSD